MPVKSDLKISYSRDKYGFLKQDNPQPFDYSLAYKEKQSTNPRMSWLRLGWLSASIPYDRLCKMSAVDIGSGNGNFVRESSNVFKEVKPYDVTGESIDDVELYGRHWDLVVLSDVLEHYDDIDKFWGLNFEWAMISFPETPNPDKFDLSRWRHFKPNEHIYLLTADRFLNWVVSHNCEVIAYSNFEDALRTRWDSSLPNISTFLIRRS